MKTLSLFIALCFCYLFSLPSFSQEVHSETEEQQGMEQGSEHAKGHSEHEFHRFSIAFAMNHTHVNTGIKDGQSKQWLAIPSFGLNFNYSISEKWGLGLHNDILIEEFAVAGNSETGAAHKSAANEEGDIAVIERGTPISSAIMIMYKPLEHLVLMAGGGMEFSAHENFGVIRFAVDVPFHLPNGWEVYGTAAYDANIDAYDSYTYGIGIAKLFK